MPDARQHAEPLDPFLPLDGGKADVELVADEIVVGIRARRRRIFHADEANAGHVAQTLE